MNKAYLFVVLSEDDYSDININNNNMVADFDQAFARLKAYARYNLGYQEELRQPKPQAYNVSIKDTHLQIWEVKTPFNTEGYGAYND